MVPLWCWQCYRSTSGSCLPSCRAGTVRSPCPNASLSQSHHCEHQASGEGRASLCRASLRVTHPAKAETNCAVLFYPQRLGLGCRINLFSPLVAPLFLLLLVSGHGMGLFSSTHSNRAGRAMHMSCFRQVTQCFSPSQPEDNTLRSFWSKLEALC